MKMPGCPTRSDQESRGAAQSKKSRSLAAPACGREARDDKVHEVDRPLQNAGLKPACASRLRRYIKQDWPDQASLRRWSSAWRRRVLITAWRLMLSSLAKRSSS